MPVTFPPRQAHGMLTETPPPPVVLVVATEWFSAHGGLSTLNRRLCIALAARSTVLCLVPASSEAEREHAAGHRVRLVTARPLPGGTAEQALIRRPALPANVRPDVVIGHGRVTGGAAKVQAEDHFPGARRLQVVHVAPDELEWWRADRADDAGVRADDRTRIELELAADAYRTIAVGPRLDQLLWRDLSVFPGAIKPVRMDPGFDSAPTRARKPPPGSPVQILLMGRIEDHAIKGVDLAARALGSALPLCDPRAEVELLVRGAPPGESSALREWIMRLAGGTGLRVTPRPFTTDAGHLKQDLLRASLVLMPSRAESFGLVGAEAVAAGTPVLVSDRSGLGSLLTEVLPREATTRIVLPVGSRGDEDITRWGHRIAAVLNDREAAFRNARAVQRTLARRRTWTAAANRVLDAVLPGHFGPSTKPAPR